MTRRKLIEDIKAVGGVEVIVVVENGVEVSEEVIHLWYSSNRIADGQ